MPCASDDTFGRWFCGVLAEPRLGVFTAHVETCAACRATVAKLLDLRTATMRSPGAPPADAASPALLGGRYRLGELLGSGSSARVFAATDVTTGRALAIKVLDPRLRDDGVWSARFVREGRALAQVQSRHVAAVFEVGWTDDARPYLAMERLDGESLEAELARSSGGAKRTPASVADDLAQIAAGLAAVHAAGIVHRDLKLANVLRSRGVLAIVDFGVARDVRQSAAPALTPNAALLGTPYYMAPEQIEAPASVDARADLWALGVCGYRLLTGAYPFAGESAGIVVARVLEGGFPPVRAARPDVPEAVARVVERCLARDPAARFGSAREVSAALAAALSGAAAPARPKSRRVSFVAVAIVVSLVFLALGGLFGLAMSRR